MTDKKTKYKSKREKKMDKKSTYTQNKIKGK